MQPEGRASRQQAVYRALLVLYPRSFRKEYGDDMVQAFGDLARDGGRRRGALWTRAFRDLLVSAPSVRWEEGIMRSSWLVVGGVLAAVAASVVVATVGLGFPGIAAALIAMAVIGGVFTWSAVAARRSGRPTEQVYRAPAKSWNWWTVLAGLIGVFYVVVTAAHLVDEPKIENVGGLAFFGGLAVAIAAGIRLRARANPAGAWLIATAALPALGLFWWIAPTIAGTLVIGAAITESVTLRRVTAA
jgi:hypothetical protein